MPTCTVCQEVKPSTEFYAKCTRCKPCARTKQRAYRLAHREEDLARKRQYHLTHRDQEAARQQVRRATATYRAYKAMYRAKRRGARIFEPINPYEIAQRDNWRCHLCHNPIKPKLLTLDHLTPITYGGNHVPDNVALAHRSCNSRRGAGRIVAQLRFW